VLKIKNAIPKFVSCMAVGVKVVANHQVLVRLGKEFLVCFRLLITRKSIMLVRKDGAL